MEPYMMDLILTQNEPISRIIYNRLLTDHHLRRKDVPFRKARNVVDVARSRSSHEISRDLIKLRQRLRPLRSLSSVRLVSGRFSQTPFV